MADTPAEPGGGVAGQLDRGRWGWLVLLTSTTTLLCCALPIVLVLFGFGAVSAALFSNLPFLATMVEYKLWLFVASGLMLVLGAWVLYRPGRACPIDPELAARCAAAQKWNTWLLIISAVVWGLGFTAAFLSVPMLDLYDRIIGG